MRSRTHKILGAIGALSVASGLAFLPPPWGTAAIIVGAIGLLATNFKKALYGEPPSENAAGAIHLANDERR